MPKKKSSGPVPFPADGELPDGKELPAGKPLPAGGAQLGGNQFPGGKKFSKDAVSVDAELGAGTAAMEVPTASATITGDAVLELARLHVGEPYILGARAPMANPGWKGPWDCAEFVSWCVYQTTGVLFGTRPLNNPVLADAYTGYWSEQARATGALITVQAAANIPGAVVLRRPATGQHGHIVVSDGQGGTVEAHDKVHGVIKGTLSGRRWDTGILVPGIAYFQSDTVVVPSPVASEPLRVMHPLMRGDRVRKVQRKLLALNYPVGAEDGIYGPQTAHAVLAFQVRNGLVADGEVGAATEKVLFG
ncbi:MAG: peptidoglycan-binding domain-containing protein [Burkholderiaceae bacterium]